MGLLDIFWKNKKDGRIFISYRRSDAQGVAGRLSDTLEVYFGNKRVFRDIEDITIGADFGQTIEKNLHSADAVIVLIGPTWVSTANPDGVRRLDDPNDWVAQEVAVAIELGIPIFPVLIEDTPMPREDELPKRLTPLLKFNALSISDRRWHSDVLRLGKILSFDIPSSNERKLDLARIAISIMFTASLVISACLVAWNALCKICFLEEASNYPDNLCSFWQTFQSCNDKLIQPSQSALPFVGVAASVLILLSIVDLISKEKRRYIYAAVGVGTILSLFFFSFQIFIGPSEEGMVSFFGSILTVTLMFSMMMMSGFKVK